MQRRSFLAGIAAGCAAPAIVRAESLMKLWVPPQNLVLEGPEWFYLNKQGEDLGAILTQTRKHVEELCGMFVLKANDPMQQARADHMEAQIRANLRGDSGLSMLIAAQTKHDREMQRSLNETVRRALDDMRRG